MSGADAQAQPGHLSCMQRSFMTLRVAAGADIMLVSNCFKTIFIEMIGVYQG